MPFELKNVGATYQRLVNKVFKPLIGKNMELYMDDMIVKSVLDNGHVDNSWGTFEVLRQYNMKLNPKKYVFGVR